MSQLTIVAGMPGSGKTTYLQNELIRKKFDAVYDDYFSGVIKKPAAPKGLYENKNSLKNTMYVNIIKDLVVGRRIAVSDIAFCISLHRNNFIAAVIAAVPEVEIHFIFFDNKPEQSKANVRSRGREGRVERELELIDQISDVYSVVTLEVKKTYDT